MRELKSLFHDNVVTSQFFRDLGRADEHRAAADSVGLVRFTPPRRPRWPRPQPHRERAGASEVIAANTLDDGFDTSPALVDDELYLRGYRHLYKIAED